MMKIVVSFWNFLAEKYSSENDKTKMNSRVPSGSVRLEIKNPEDERVKFFLYFSANFTKFDICNVFVRPGGIILSS